MCCFCVAAAQDDVTDVGDVDVSAVVLLFDFGG